MKLFPIISVVFLIFIIESKSASVSVRNSFTAQNSEVAGYKYNRTEFILITSTAPNLDLAKKFAKELVEMKLAGLVNIFQPGLSIFVWDGQLHEVSEILLYIYTRKSLFENVEEYIRANHPDEEPGALALPIVQGSTSFLEWLANGTQINNY